MDGLCRKWLMFETNLPYLSGREVSRSAGLNIRKYDHDTQELIVEIMGLFVPLIERDDGITIGYAPFYGTCLDTWEMGPVSEERYVMDMSSLLPKLSVSIRFENGRIVLIAIKFFANGDHTNRITVLPLSRNETVRLHTEHFKKDCQFCLHRDVPCTCSDDMRSRVADIVPRRRGILVSGWGESMLNFVNLFLGEQETSRLIVYHSADDGKPLTVKTRVVRVSNHFSAVSIFTSKLKEMYVQKETLKCLPPSSRIAGPKAQCEERLRTCDGEQHRVPMEECPQCGARFARRCDMTRHVRVVHEHVKRHPCLKCGHLFAQQSHLREHIASVHERRKDELCQTCGAAFTLRRKLERHIREVHKKERRKRCTECDKGYVHDVDLRRHLETVHNIKRAIGAPRIGTR